MNLSRIPDLSDKSFGGVQSWFASMSDHDLLFHPDDAPENIIVIATGKAAFSSDESHKLEEVLDTMFELHGNDVYEAAYPVFMKKVGIH